MWVVVDEIGCVWPIAAFAEEVHASGLDEATFRSFAVRNLGVVVMFVGVDVLHIICRPGKIYRDTFEVVCERLKAKCVSRLAIETGAMEALDRLHARRPDRVVIETSGRGERLYVVSATAAYQLLQGWVSLEQPILRDTVAAQPVQFSQQNQQSCMRDAGVGGTLDCKGLRSARRPLPIHGLIVRSLDLSEEDRDALLSEIGERRRRDPIETEGMVYRRTWWGMNRSGTIWLEDHGRGFESTASRAFDGLRGRELARWDDKFVANSLAKAVMQAFSQDQPIAEAVDGEWVMPGVERGWRSYRRVVKCLGFRRGRYEIAMLSGIAGKNKIA